MALRTYYWNDRKLSRLQNLKQSILKKEVFGFKHGNVGDIFNVDLIKYLYNETPYSCRTGNNKLLLVGSVASVIRENDIVCGIGWKGNNLSSISKEIAQTKVYGVRGPLTRSFFEKHGADLSNLKFEYDPGLLIKEVCNVSLKWYYF